MAETLQEYLVELGFKVNDAQYKKFIKPVAEAGKAVRELGESVFAAASAVYFSVERIANHFETLYYTAQRTKVSVGYLQAYKFAAGQIGLTAEDATQSLESMAAAIRTSPGLGALAGGAKNPAELIERIRSLSGGQYFVAQRFGQMFGINEKAFFQMWHHAAELRKEEEYLINRQKELGFNAEESSKRFKDFGHEVNRLQSDISILTDIWARSWLPAAEKGNEWFRSAINWFASLDQGTRDYATTLATFLVPSLALSLFKLNNMKIILGLIQRAWAPLLAAAAVHQLAPEIGSNEASAIHDMIERGANPESMWKLLFGPAGFGISGKLGDVLWKAITGKDRPGEQYGPPEPYGPFLPSGPTTPIGAQPGKQGSVINNNNVQTTINLTGDNSSVVADRIVELQKMAWMDASRHFASAVR